MNNVYIKNNSDEIKTYTGQTIEIGAYHKIENKFTNWQNSSNLITDIATGDAVVAKDDSGLNDLVDIVDGLNHLKGIVYRDIDESNREVVRIASTEKGWALADNYASLESCVYGGGYIWKDMNGNDLDLTSYHYDTNGTLLTNQTDVDNLCIRTDFIFKFGIDIELDRGSISHNTRPASDFMIWGAFGAISGGTVLGAVEFIRNLNLYHTSDEHFIDGKSSKLLKYDNDLPVGAGGALVPHSAHGIDTNQALIRCEHAVGYKYKFQVGIGYYRAI